jgi:outer membrane protein assembly factor BamB
LAALSSCGGKAVSETQAEPRIEKPKPPTSVPMWLGNATRNFYGTGPWQDGQLTVVWEVETDFITGRLHKDPWGGTSWPGQPSINDGRVYFPSADGNVLPNTITVARSGSSKQRYSQQPLQWLSMTRLSPAGSIITSTLNASDGSVVWDYEAGFRSTLTVV